MKSERQEELSTTDWRYARSILSKVRRDAAQQKAAMPRRHSRRIRRDSFAEPAPLLLLLHSMWGGEGV